MTRYIIEIEGMSCGGCVNGVRRALAALAVELDSVELGRATLRADPARVSEAALRGAIEGAGFDVRDLRAEA